MREPRGSGVHALVPGLSGKLAVLPRFLPLPQPFSPSSRYPVVPVDHVARAIRALVDVEAPPARTYTLVDPEAPTLATLLDEIALRVGAPRLRVRFPLARPLARISGLPVVAPALRQMGIKVDFLSYLDRPHDHDVANARVALDPKGVVCPPLLSYLDRVVERTS